MLIKPSVGNRYIATENNLVKLPNSVLNMLFRQKPFTRSFIGYAINEFKKPKIDLTKQTLDYLDDEERKIIERNESLLAEKLKDLSIYEFVKLRFDEQFANYLADSMLRGISSGMRLLFK